MTENEIREYIEELRHNANMLIKSGYATTGISTHFSKSADLIEELLAYRAIGTVEELKTATKYIRLVAKHGTTGEVIETCAEYESIGTVEQCRGAVLLQKQKKIRPGYRGVDEPLCPYCDKVLKHEDTCECGQRIDWSDTSETENT